MTAGGHGPGELCDRVLEMVGGRAEAELTARVGRSALTRFANSAIHQNVAEQGAEVSVRVVLGQRVGVASANQLDEASLRDATARAEAVARSQPDNPDFAGLPAPTPWERLPSYDPQTAEATPERRAEGVAKRGSAKSSGRPMAVVKSCQRRPSGVSAMRNQRPSRQR